MKAWEMLGMEITQGLSNKGVWLVGAGSVSSLVAGEELERAPLQGVPL